MITTRTITTAQDVSILVAEIDRHHRRNALDRSHVATLTGTVRQASDDGIRAIVITGAGRTFCAGADFGEVTTDEFRTCLVDLLDTVATCPVPVLAAVNGPAIGAGFQLALACDLRVAGDNARFCMPTARFGFAADPATVDRVAEMVGGSRARAVLLACDELDADQALDWGLVHRRGGLPEAKDWAAELASYAPLSLGFYKRVLADRDGPRRLDELAAIWRSDDVREGAAARAEKRWPRFRGR